MLTTIFDESFFITGLLAFVLTSESQLQVVDRVVVIVDDNIVLYSEIANRITGIQQNLQRNGQQSPPVNQLLELVTEQLIDERLQLNLAKRVGMELTNSDIIMAVEKYASEQGLTASQLYANARNQMGLTRKQVQTQITNELIINEIKNYFVNDRIIISEDEVNRFLQSKEGQFWKMPDLLLSQIAIAASGAEAADKVQQVYNKIQNGEDFAAIAVTYSEGATALQGGNIGWRKAVQFPEPISDAISTLAKGETSAIIEFNGAYFIYKVNDIRESQQQRTVIQRKARHILIQPNEIRSEKQARTLIQSLANRIKTIEDFENVARNFSEDYSNAMQGGDLDWVSPGQMVQPFEQALFEADFNELTTPVQTEFGWHLIWVEDEKEVDVSDIVIQNQALQLLRSRQFDEESKLWLQELRDNAYIQYVAKENAEKQKQRQRELRQEQKKK